MAATVEDHDYPKRAAHKLGVSEDVALALESYVDQYADMKVLNELQRSDRSFTSCAYVPSSEPINRSTVKKHNILLNCQWYEAVATYHQESCYRHYYNKK